VDAWKAEVAVNGNSTTFKLNTDADGTGVSDNLSWLSTISLQNTGVRLYGPGGKQLKVLETFEADL